ncbi:phosphate system cyclin PHO80 [Cladophialophora psammophila CBS 110553]|uniref:Phosphate system cyclin PHO80 n=1 Tax=Cladophialophora psammophila CBS 110553 TaxID=1182543 RepID=W9WLB6_9EURO|nr:phosphate system cyclin PHO80 [Cladophialophora psammophila CBS 110553]EXJ65795.1 phosphate system cyclin PHO80 [Cladophialophora psammophila CBS 110553]
MLATSPSPNIPPTAALESGVAVYSSSRPQYDHPMIKPVNPRTTAVEQASTPRKRPPSYDLDFQKPRRIQSTRSLDRYKYSPRPQPRVKMVDAATQYSPPNQQKAEKTPTSTIAGLQLSEGDDHPPKTAPLPSAAKRRDDTVGTTGTAGTAGGAANPAKSESTTGSGQTKRLAAEPPAEPEPRTNGLASEEAQTTQHSPVKKARPDAPPVRIMPLRYETCNTRDLVVLISSMLMELIRYNDAIPLREGQLTRFHSRAPPGISVLDYLQRLTTHATLSPPILLSVVYYIDRLCALYPAFTISSLTVHRFLITSATVASKGLSDSFWTNKTYARVGGVSMKELALLELEFLTRMEWRIVPKPEVLVDYYKSLIARNSQYQLETT